ncbi:MAG TPA: MTH938/NDUFAF3 family protein [Legionella sp.]|nr:MTH938/NDUFAF3 family protein [Legionella sp.]
MQINLEAADPNAVQGYSDNKIQINSIIYENSLIVSREEIITDLTIKNIQDMDESFMDLLLKTNPELIIIGHRQLGKFPPMNIVTKLSQKQIGIECMEFGAACRTYNILLGEMRSVVAGFIL